MNQKILGWLPSCDWAAMNVVSIAIDVVWKIQYHWDKAVSSHAKGISMPNASKPKRHTTIEQTFHVISNECNESCPVSMPAKCGNDIS